MLIFFINWLPSASKKVEKLKKKIAPLALRAKKATRRQQEGKFYD